MEMPKDILEIIDTSVKIGLGALISGVTTYLVTKKNHGQEFKKISLENKHKLISELCEEMEEYFNGFHTYCGEVFARIRNENLIDKESKTKLPITVSDVFTNTYPQKNKALSKLKILQITDAITAIKNCATSCSDLLEHTRENSYSDKELSEKEMYFFICEVNKNSELFYLAINKYLTSLS
jgi:hypothetical protein